MSTNIEERIHKAYKAELKRLYRVYDGGKKPNGQAYLYTATAFKIPVKDVKEAILRDKARISGKTVEELRAESEAKNFAGALEWHRRQMEMKVRGVIARRHLQEIYDRNENGR
jgi:hypothetical protein